MGVVCRECACVTRVIAARIVGKKNFSLAFVLGVAGLGNCVE